MKSTIIGDEVRQKAKSNRSTSQGARASCAAHLDSNRVDGPARPWAEAGGSSFVARSQRGSGTTFSGGAFRANTSFDPGQPSNALASDALSSTASEIGTSEEDPCSGRCDTEVFRFLTHRVLVDIKLPGDSYDRAQKEALAELDGGCKYAKEHGRRLVCRGFPCGCDQGPCKHKTPKVLSIVKLPSGRMSVRRAAEVNFRILMHGGVISRYDFDLIEFDVTIHAHAFIPGGCAPFPMSYKEWGPGDYPNW